MVKKKTALDKITAELRKARKERGIVTKAPRTSKTVAKLPTKKGQEEEEKTRAFFESIQDMKDTQEQVNKFYYEFVMAKGAPKSRKELWDILHPMGYKYFRKFVDKYLKQRELKVLEFAQQYQQKPKVAKTVARIQEKIKSQEAEELEHERKLQKAMAVARREAKEEEAEFGDLFAPEEAEPEGVFGEEVAGFAPEEEEVEDAEEEQKRAIAEYKQSLEELKQGKSEEELLVASKPSRLYKTQRVGPKGELIEGEEEALVPQVFVPVNQRCLNVYNRLPWIEDGFEATVWLASPDTQKISTQYIHINESKQKEGRTWNRANNLFVTELLCGPRRMDRFQIGDTYHLYDEQGKLHSFILAYETPRNFIIQDEDLFEKEREWFREEKRSIKDKLDRLLARPLSVEARQLGVSILSQFFDSEYAESVDAELSRTSTIKEYLTKLADIVVFLRENDLSRIFPEQARRGYFVPEILPTLTEEDKLPEVFADARVDEKTREQVRQYLQRSKNEFVEENAYMLYHLGDPTARRQYIQREEVHPPNIALPSKGDVCPDTENWDLIYYDEDGEVYCFSITELSKAFKQKNYINPKTGNRFTQKFIDKVRRYQPLEIEAWEIIEPSDEVSPEEYVTEHPEWVKEKVAEMCDAVRVWLTQSSKERLNTLVIDEILNKLYQPYLYLDTMYKPTPGSVPPDFAKVVMGCLEPILESEEEEKIPPEYTIPFWKKIIALAKWELKPKGDEEKQVLPSEPELAPDLLDIIRRDIKELEEELVEEEKRKSEEESGDESDESSHHHEKEEEVIIEEKSPPTENVCHYCQEHVDVSKSLKSMIKYEKGSKIAQFCSSKCFEEADGKKYWPQKSKHKSRRKTPKSS